MYVRRLDIFAASQKGHLRALRSLVENNIELVNARGENEFTPLMFSALNGHEEAVKFLIGKGSNVNAVSKGIHTPLMFAAINGHINVCKLLIDNGADVNATDRDGGTPLRIAVGYAYEYGDTEIIEFLIANGGNIKTKNAMGENLVHGAGWSKRPEIAKQLTVRYGLDINAKNLNLRTPLWQASFTGHEEAVKILIGLGADVDIKDVTGSTALFTAAEEGHAEVVELLIDAGANVNEKNNNGETPLDIAIAKGHAKVVKILRKYSGKSGK
jgi:serine/threonine-protein phosphatase 6 regulatory ankyrin repeat subunit B